jgi:hypothetical protein
MPAEKGNRHNLKHGLYGRVIRSQEARELDRMSHDLVNEINVLRVYVARLSDQLSLKSEYDEDDHAKVELITRMSQVIGILTSRRASLSEAPAYKGEAIAAAVTLSTADWDKV